MIYVWAYEQGKLSKRNIGTRGNKETKTVKETMKEARATPGVLGCRLSSESGAVDGQDQDQADKAKVQDLLVPWVVKPNRPKTKAEREKEQASSAVEEQVFHRYYHLFLDGELQDLIEAAAVQEGYEYLGLHMGAIDEKPAAVALGKSKWLRLTGLGWEMDNWWIKGQVGVY